MTADQLKAALRARLQAARSDGFGPGSLLGDDVADEITELLGLTGPSDPAALRLAGVVLWFRHLAKEVVFPEAGGSDRAFALQLFHLLSQINPDAVPDFVRPHLPGPDDPMARINDLIVEMQRVAKSQDPAELVALIDRVDRVLVDLDPDDPQAVWLAAGLGPALNLRYFLFGRREDIDRAVEPSSDARRRGAPHGRIRGQDGGTVDGCPGHGTACGRPRAVAQWRYRRRSR